jgi:hypothetical protein
MRKKKTGNLLETFGDLISSALPRGGYERIELRKGEKGFEPADLKLL